MSDVFWSFHYNPNSCPCRDCKERAVGCHGTCQKYKDWQATRKPYLNTYSERNYGGKRKQ